MKKQNESAAKGRKDAFVAKPGEGIKVVAADGAAADKTRKDAARRRVMRKIEARRNRTNREVAVGAAEYLLTASQLCGATLIAAKTYAQNAIETLKERGLADDAGDLTLARATLRIATEIDRTIRDLLDDLEEADRSSRLA